MKKLLFIVIFIYNFTTISAKNKWGGLTLRIQSGIYIDYLEINSKDGTYSQPSGIDATFGWGIEYSWVIEDQFYLSIDLGFPYYNKIFKGEEVTANPMFGNFNFSSFYLYFIPITYVHFGYATKDWVFTIGPAYY